MEFNLADLFESVVDVATDQTAVVGDGRRLSYAELEVRANRLAHRLATAGIGTGDRVGVQLTNGPEYLEAMLACFKIRAVPVNVNYRYLSEELRYLYSDAGLTGLVFHSRYRAAVAGALDASTGPRLLLEVGDESGRSGLGEDYEEALAGQSTRRDFGPRSADDVYCIYTGGTTGMPKGVLWRHEDIFFAAMGGGDPLSLGNVIGGPEELAGRIMHPGLAALASPPFMHASGQWLAFTMLFGGGKVVTLPAERFDPVALWRLVEAEAVNVLVVVGDAMAVPVLDWLEAHPGEIETSSLLAVGSGGAALSASTKRRLAAALPTVMVVDAFGSSETGQLGGSAPADDPYGAPHLHVDERTAVLDDELQPVVPGSEKVGRLARSGHIPIGYLGDPKKSAATFVEAGGIRWALPGDLAAVGEDGTITLLGRGALTINTGGEKVYPEEVEQALREHGDVADVVVLGAPHERFGEQVVAVVEPRPGARVDAQALLEICRRRLAAYKVPRLVVETDAVARSPAGKPDYRWARALVDRARQGSRAGPASTASPFRAAALSGPVTGGRIIVPVCPVPFDLARHGYVEEEFLASGVASALDAAGPLTAEGRWDVEPGEAAPYATRIVVRRPAESVRFSGTTVVEWCNVSGGVEAAPDWSYLHEEILRSGHAYVAVSAQALGVDGGTALLEVPGTRPGGGLVAACPERYRTLTHPGDRFAFDVFSQIGRSLRAQGDPDPLGGLPLRHLLAMGESQSAFFLTTYVNASHHGAEIYDGFLIHSRGGSSASLSGEVTSHDMPGGVRIREDVRVPVLMLETETDVTAVLDFAPARQPDTAAVRTWEIAGTAHADAYLVGAYAHLLGCDWPVNSGPHHEVAQAALDALVRWVAEGAPPASAAPLELAGNSPPLLARDRLGNALRGVRTPAVDVPVATLSGEPADGASAICSLFGSTVPFDGPTLRRLYGDKGGYVSAYEESLDAAVVAGFILPADRPALLAKARAFVFPK